MKSTYKYRVELVREEAVSFGTKPITSSTTAAEVVREIIGSIDREMFAVLCLDNKNLPIGFNIVSIGSLSSSIVHPREVFKPLVLCNAAGMICFHNHPSGDPTASFDDIEITRRLKECAEVLGFEFLDHVILGDKGRVFSFNKENLL